MLPVRGTKIPARSTVPIAWSSLLELMTIMCRKARPSADDITASDADWYWTLTIAIEAFRDAWRCHGGDAELSIGTAPKKRAPKKLKQ
jgi:hypothetical protein